MAQAFHFKGGRGSKTGTGGHLSGHQVTSEIAKVRGLKAGETAISPAAFPDLLGIGDFKAFAKKVRDRTDGIPVGFKIAASHIEEDIDFTIEVGIDNIILDGRGRGTGSAPVIQRDHINDRPSRPSCTPEGIWTGWVRTILHLSKQVDYGCPKNLPRP